MTELNDASDPSAGHESLDKTHRWNVDLAHQLMVLGFSEPCFQDLPLGIQERLVDRGHVIRVAQLMPPVAVVPQGAKRLGSSRVGD